MKYNVKRYLSTVGVMAMLLASLLPISAFAADCVHVAENGVCTECGETILAYVGETLFVDMAKAVEAAKDTEEKTVTLLADLSNLNLNLEGVTLQVPSEGEVTLTKCSFTGNKPVSVNNAGKLVLQEVTVNITDGAYALYIEGAEGETLTEVTINGGSFTGKAYGIGAANTKLKLGTVLQGEGEEKIAVAPVIAHHEEKAAFSLENSSIEVLSDLGESAYTVESATPGVLVAVAEPADEEAPAIEAQKTWFTVTNGIAVFGEESGTWTLTGDIGEAVTVDTTEFTYDGTAHMPTYTVELYGKTLVKDTDYTLTVTKDGSAVEQAVNAGTYKVTIKGLGQYTGQHTHEFTIKPVALTVQSVTAEDRAYDGTTTVNITGAELTGVLSGETVTANVTNAKGTLESAKPGTYNKVVVSGLTLTGTHAANYTLTQPEGTVPTTVVVRKANLTASLSDITATSPVASETITVEKLGAGMPADAGTLTYKNKNQGTGEGDKVIVFDWSVDANGKLTSKIGNGSAGDQIIYQVAISSENYNDAVVKVVVTLGSESVDTTAIKIQPAATALVYNGKAQTVVLEVKVGDTVLKEGTDYEVKYPTDATNVGDKEATVQLKGNYSGSATFKYTIAKAKVTVSGATAQDKTYDGTTKATVTAGSLSGAVSGDDVKVTATGTFDSKNSGTRTVTVTYALTGKAAGNYELTTTTGTATAKISPVTATQLRGRISGLSTGNVDSGDKGTLQNVIAAANSALEDGGLSSSEKSNITNVKWDAETLISRIESAASAAATESIRTTADVTAENVKLTDQAALTKAKADLNTALTTYGGNYTDGETTQLKQKQTRVTEALEVITRVNSAQSMIGALPKQITGETTVDETLIASVEKAQEAVDALSDYEKTLLGEDEQLKLTTLAEAVASVDIGANDVADGMQNTTTAGEEDGGSKLSAWIWGMALVAALAAAAACAGLIWYKRKQEQDSANW